MGRFDYYCALSFFLALCANSQTYTISTVAGTDRLLNGTPAIGVPLRDPRYVAVDSSGSVYLSDVNDSRIRRISPLGVISTLAGTGIAGFSGDRGRAIQAQISRPFGIAVDGSGNVFFADRDNLRVRRISLDGTINTVAGNGTKGSGGDNGSALSAQIDPIAVAVDGSGNLYIADGFNFKIRKVDSIGIITTIAGSGSRGYAGDNGPATSALIDVPTSIAVDANGNVYFVDSFNFRVRRIDPSGMLATIAGNGTFGTISDGAQAITAVMIPQGVAVDVGGSVYISDFNRDVVRRVDKSGQIFTVAGNASTGFSGDNDSATRASLDSPFGLALDGTNQLYIADEGNSRIRRVAAGIITTVAGTGIGDGGPATSAFLNGPRGLAVDGNGNIAVADTNNFRVRRFSPGGSIGTFGQVRGSPFAVGLDQAGNYYVTDAEPRVLKLTPTGGTTIIAGSGTQGYAGDGGAATSAAIDSPTGVAVDSGGNVYFTDDANLRIRKVTPAGVISTIAGNGKLLASGDGGPALSAAIDPFDIAIDGKNNLYVADEINCRIRKITPDGTITTVAGTGQPGYDGDGGLATDALLLFPTGVSTDTAGNLYIADAGNGFVRRVTPGGLITTIAGNGRPTPSSGDGGPALSAQLDPRRITVDSAANLYVTDGSNDRIRKLTPKLVTPSSIVIVAGNNQSGTVGARLTAALIVKVTDPSSSVIPNVLINYTVTPAGTATVNPSPSITTTDGTARVTVTLGNTTGTVTITASAGAGTTVQFTATINPLVSPTAPQISAGGIASAGLSTPSVKALSPSAIVTIFGQKFAPDGTVKLLTTDDLVGGRIPTVLAGVCVTFGTLRAPIFAVLPGQLNVQVPALTLGSTTVRVTTKCDTAQAETSNPEPATVQAAAPEFFYFTHNANGRNPIAATDAISGAYIGAPGLLAGATFSPAQPGEYLTLYATGFGATSPSFAPGELPGAAGQVTAPVVIKFGGITLSPADILYVGVSQNAGLYQLNIRVPDGIADGDQTLEISIAGVSSPSSAFITVKAGT